MIIINKELFVVEPVINVSKNKYSKGEHNNSALSSSKDSAEISFDNILKDAMVKANDDI